uniref:Uncharacterized protein n=1 Tax=viral metagenome TaxID=1070528 RepID=A0A6M3XYK0_9ZZZZ
MIDKKREDDMEISWGYEPCENGHVFLWESKTTADIVAPKGTPCQCGQYKADGKGGILEKEG